MFPNTDHKLRCQWYDHILSEQFTPDRKFLNLGYWKDGVENHESAAVAMVDLIAETAQLKKGQNVLDVGCGFGETSIHLAAHYGVNVHGLDLNPKQIQAAKDKAKTLDPEQQKRLHFQQGSATELMDYVEAHCFDAIVCIESAFHYRTRTDFLAQAHSVLKPGGSIVLADLVLHPQPRFPMAQWLQNTLFHFHGDPQENVYDKETYLKHMEELGFQDINYNSISDRVWHPYCRYLIENAHHLNQFTMNPDFQLLLSPGPDGDDYRRFFMEKMLPNHMLHGLLLNPFTAALTLGMMSLYFVDYAIIKGTTARA